MFIIGDVLRASPFWGGYVDKELSDVSMNIDYISVGDVKDDVSDLGYARGGLR